MAVERFQQFSIAWPRLALQPALRRALRIDCARRAHPVRRGRSPARPDPCVGSACMVTDGRQFKRWGALKRTGQVGQLVWWEHRNLLERMPMVCNARRSAK
jgi:hypothetical protein